MNSKNLQHRSNFFDQSYFSVYGNDPRRLIMYRAERDRIEMFKSSGKILDVGCGIGAFLDEFNSSRWQKYGVDISSHAIAISRSKGIIIQEGDYAYDYPSDFFDVIVFRGSLQHLSHPFKTIQDCYRILTPSGLIVFLATPNTNSPYFNRFKTLPFLTPTINILQPSDLMMKYALQNMGFKVARIVYPYLDTPYARPLFDHLFYLLSFLGLRRNFAFWRSSMEIYALKPLLP